MDGIILLELGQTLCTTALLTTNAVERGLIEDRCESLLIIALKVYKKRASPQTRLFFYSSEEEDSANDLLDEAITFIARRFFGRDEFCECIEALKGIATPYSYYFQAVAHQKLSAFLGAKICLDQAMNLMDGQENHPLLKIMNSQGI